jgi:hypothetical protein
VAVEPLDLDALDRERYADVEELLCTWLRQAFAAMGVTVSTGLPEGDELAEALTDDTPYYIAVEAFGGADRNPAQDVASVDVDVYAPADLDGNPDRAGASDAAERVRAGLLFHLSGYDNGTATVSAVATMSRPTARPYDDNSNVTRFSAAYQVTVKSHN